jgi:hypothetical protein
MHPSFAGEHSRAIAPAQFVSPGNTAPFLIQAAKPSYTAGTLCEIPPQISWKIYNIKFLKNLTNIKK